MSELYMKWRSWFPFLVAFNFPSPKTELPVWTVSTPDLYRCDAVCKGMEQHRTEFYHLVRSFRAEQKRTKYEKLQMWLQQKLDVLGSPYLFVSLASFAANLHIPGWLSMALFSSTIVDTRGETLEDADVLRLLDRQALSLVANVLVSSVAPQLVHAIQSVRGLFVDDFIDSRFTVLVRYLETFPVLRSLGENWVWVSLADMRRVADTPVSLQDLEMMLALFQPTALELASITRSLLQKKAWVSQVLNFGVVRHLPSTACLVIKNASTLEIYYVAQEALYDGPYRPATRLALSETPFFS